MKRLFVILSMLLASACFAQKARKLSAFFSFQYNKTLYDRTISNNSGGLGFGLQTTLNTGGPVQPTLELNADRFFGTKELRLTPEGKPVYSKGGVTSIFAGPQIGVGERLFFSATAGASIYNGAAHFGLRPAVGVYLSQSRKWFLKSSFTDVFQRDDFSDKSFGYLSFALALKLF
jgi:hypothetical protein